MSKTKVLCVVGTRPEVIKLAPVIRVLRGQAQAFETRVLATGQHRELLSQMLEVFAIRPDRDLALMRTDQNLSHVAGRALIGISDFLEAQPADVVLAQGDTATVMAAGMACFFNRVRFGHIEAGLRTGNRWAPYPEEFNRRVAALAADWHFAPTGTAAENLLREGVPREAVRVTGNTVIDALLHVLHATRPPVPPVGDERPYVLMTCHRRESFGAPMIEIFEAVRDFFAGQSEFRLWYPVHPNPHVSGPAGRILAGAANVALTGPLDYVSFAHAMNGAHLLLTDSGGIQEEGPSLGKPVIVLRDVTERPEGVAAGTCLLVGPHREGILAALSRLLGDKAAYRRMAQAQNPYGDGRASERIVAALRGEPLPDWGAPPAPPAT